MIDCNTGKPEKIVLGHDAQIFNVTDIVPASDGGCVGSQSLPHDSPHVA